MVLVARISEPPPAWKSCMVSSTVVRVARSSATLSDGGGVRSCTRCSAARDLREVGREVLLHVHQPVEADDHHRQRAVRHQGRERAGSRLHRGAAGGVLELRDVDVDHDRELLAPDLPAGEEVGQLDLLLVLEHLEIALGEVGDRVPLLVADVDVDVDHVDVDALARRRVAARLRVVDRRRLVFLGPRRGRGEQERRNEEKLRGGAAPHSRAPFRVLTCGKGIRCRARAMGERRRRFRPYNPAP